MRTGTLVGSSHLVAALSLITVQVVLARLLTAEQFGSLLLMQAIVTFVEAMVTARAGEVALFALGRNWTGEPSLVHAYTVALRRAERKWSLLSYGALCVAALALQPVFDVPIAQVCVLALVIPAQAGYGVSKSLFIVSDHLRNQALFEIAHSLAYVVAIFAAVLVSGVTGFLLVYVAAAAVKSITADHVSRRYCPAPSTMSPSVAIPGSVSFNALLRNLCASAINQGDVIVLGALASKETVAIYKIARTLASVPSRIMSPVWSVLRPKFIRLLRDHEAAALRRTIVKPALAFAATIIVILPLAHALAPWLLSAIYGAPYRAAAVPLIILLMGTWIFSAATGWFGTIAIMTSSKTFPSSIYVVLSVAILAGSAVAGGAPVATACAVAAAMCAAALMAWVWLYSDSRICA